MAGKKTGSKKTPAPAPATAKPKPRRQWRDYRTEAGGRPVNDFIDALDDDGAASVAAGMRDVRQHGLTAAKHLRGEVYEVIADTKDKWIRLLFATQGRYSQVLLSLNVFEKKTNKTPPHEIDLAEKRLADWKERGKQKKKAKPPPK